MADKFKQKNQGYVGHDGGGRRESQEPVKAVQPSGHAPGGRDLGTIKEGTKQVGQGYVGSGGGRREAQHPHEPISPSSHVASAQSSGVPKNFQKAQRPQLMNSDEYDAPELPGC